ncbi:MAG: chorismate synthase [Bacteroidaceae bacterium]|nr:chorismate synthase [Bacteroidaceae bacterium]MBQ2809215.1 chorismate synthase [Bacteroidaceae bacterium]
MNSFGQLLRLTTFGESHGAAIGGVLDGFPAGVVIDEDFIRSEMQRRRPGQSAITTQRNESDEVQFLSGIFEGRSTGTPIAFVIANSNNRSGDYENLRDAYRPSHADYVYDCKYGVRDHRGGGRSSARETAVRVCAGALAKLALKQLGISVQAFTSQVGTIVLEGDYTAYDLSLIETNAVRCPHAVKAAEMERLIMEVKREGDTVGGVVTCVVKGAPLGLGEPLYGKLTSSLAHAMLSINAAKGFEYGNGFASAAGRGSQQNDLFYNNDGAIATRTNNSGGIQGGISNGNDIFFRVAFKPVATLLKEQQTVTRNGEDTTLLARGRHDPCVVPRAVPVVEAMAALVVLDHYMLARAKDRLFV